MMLDLPTVKTIYRAAVDPRAHDREGDDWWYEVAAEVEAVVGAPDVGAAADIIAWWHHDWSAVGDTARRAARRIRSAAARAARNH